MVTNLEHLLPEAVVEALQRSRKIMMNYSLEYCRGCEQPFFTDRASKQYCSKNCNMRSRFGNRNSNIKVDNSSLPFTVVEPSVPPPPEKTEREKKLERIKDMLEHGDSKRAYLSRHKELMTVNGPTTYLEFLKKVIAAKSPKQYIADNITDSAVRDRYQDFDYYYYTQVLDKDISMDSDTLLEDCKES